MNKMNWKFFKVVTLILVIFVSGLALYIHQESADFDPIKEIQRLKSENKRDDALDMVKFFKENEQANPDEIKALDIDLEYSTAEKIKSLVWDGLFKGQVYDKQKHQFKLSMESPVDDPLKTIESFNRQFQLKEPERSAVERA